MLDFRRLRRGYCIRVILPADHRVTNLNFSDRDLFSVNPARQPTPCLQPQSIRIPSLAARSLSSTPLLQKFTPVFETNSPQGRYWPQVSGRGRSPVVQQDTREQKMSAGGYYDIDAILSEEIRVPCSFTLDAVGMGVLDPTTSDEDLSQGAKVSPLTSLMLYLAPALESAPTSVNLWGGR